MSTTIESPAAERFPEPAPQAGVNYLNAHYGWRSWLFTLDHKRIAILYMITITLMFILGGIGAVLVRLELLTPEGDLLDRDTYNKMFTMHGIVMIFYFLIPSIPAVLGNFILPIMIGAKDLAFPRLNLASWYVFVFSAFFALYVFLSGGIDTGWTFYTPYSSAFSHSKVVMTGLAVLIVGFSSIFTAINFIVTIHQMRAPGMTWFKMPLFAWTMYATSLIIVLGTPVLSITVLLLAIERFFGVPVFANDPLLFQHLFWFYSHPAVYIMILPGMGVVSELVTAFSRKRVFGYEFVAFASLAIAALGFLVWGHHMFVTDQSPYAKLIFSVLSMCVAIPSAVKVFNWTATLYKGSIVWETPMLYALGFIGLFTMGGLTGLFLATLAVDYHVSDTYFIVAHFHFIMVGGAVMAYMGGLHYWWPKMTGRMYPEWWGRVSAVILFVGFNLTFLPQFVLGYLGMPRRVQDYSHVPDWQVLNVLSTAGASILGVGYFIPLVYLLLSLFIGKRAGPNPWGATGLEWTTRSPPPTDNFAETPIVTEPPYNYPDRESGVSVRA